MPLGTMQKLQRLFTHDPYVALVISLNAVVLCLLSFKALENNLLLEGLDVALLLYFLFEAVFKIRQQSWRVYIASGWNRFDFLIVLLTIPSVMLLFRASLSNFAFVFLFRIIRVLRFFKFLKFIPNIGELVAGVQRAFKASVFVLLAFFLYSFVVSLISCRLFQTASPDLFGDPVTSFYNIFKVFTIEGWYEIPEQVIADGQMAGAALFFTKLYFILIVLSGGLFGLSIVNAIFVEEMVRDNNDLLEARVLEIDRKLDQLLQATAPSAEATVEPVVPAIEAASPTIDAPTPPQGSYWPCF
ncbi:MAG: hypothetical protein OHK0039_47630 [Bacteroidia bacterium]